MISTINIIILMSNLGIMMMGTRAFDWNVPDDLHGSSLQSYCDTPSSPNPAVILLHPRSPDNHATGGLGLDRPKRNRTVFRRAQGPFRAISGESRCPASGSAGRKRSSQARIIYRTVGHPEQSSQPSPNQDAKKTRV